MGRIVGLPASTIPGNLMLHHRRCFASCCRNPTTEELGAAVAAGCRLTS